MKKKSFIFIFPLILLCSCNSLFSKFYGIKTPYYVNISDINNFAQKFIDTLKNDFLIDSTFMSYINKFKPQNGSENLCETSNIIYNDLSQPIQAMYFNKERQLVSYFTNCYAGGFPNLNWNKENNFSIFPPASLANVHKEIVLSEICQFFISTNTNYDLITQNTYDYIIVIFWNKFMKRQALNLIKLIQKNAQNHNALLIYVNNDNFFSTK